MSETPAPAASGAFTIFGAGLAGSLLAIALSRVGCQVELIERRPDPRRAGAERGRSINLALSARGIDALQRLGLADEVLATALPMRGRAIHDRAGRITFQSYSSDGTKAINSVSRSGLNFTLLNAAERQPNVSIRFGLRCVNVDFDARHAEVLDAATGAATTIPTAPHIIGADGAFSGVRSAMQKRDLFNYSQSYLSHGYKELTIPPAPEGAAARWRLDPNALHIWPRGGSMMIALPNHDGSFTCTLFWPFEGPHSFSALRDAASIGEFFAREYPDALPLMPTLAEDYLANPVGSLVTVRCAPWSLGDRATLVGDAAHAIVPFFGQGMNASFEDCRDLAEELARKPGDVARAFSAYERRRKPNADAIADLAYANFIEMRDTVASPWFRARKHAEHALERWLPGLYTSLYEMVSFSTIPYAEARERARRQGRAVVTIAVVVAVAALGLAAMLLSS